MSDATDEPNTKGPAKVLAGVRVFEVGTAIASPAIGKYLANFGADVLKVESRNNPDVVRALGSAWAAGVEELAPFFCDTGPYVTEMNAGKRSVALDLKRPEAIEAAQAILAHCDVFITNITTPAMAALGLSYEAVKAVRPDIIYVALPGFGSDPTSLYYEYVAWGPNQAPLVGLDNLTGYPDQEPAGVASVALPDYISALHGAIAVLAALEYRDRTGEGSFVDISQFEANVNLLGPFVYEQALNGTETRRMGNRTPWSAPEGVYPCRDGDSWVAISVTSDAAWCRLGRVIGADWCSEARYATTEGRIADHDLIDEEIAAWTRGYTPAEVATMAQAQGVAAHALIWSEHSIIDPQIRDRQMFHAGPSGRFDVDLWTGVPITLSDSKSGLERAGPAFGEHTAEVLTDLAGYDEEKIAQLADAEVAYLQHEPDHRLTRPYAGYIPFLVPSYVEEI